MAIKLDISPNSIVIFCTDCGHWRGFAFDRLDAERRGAAHEANVHPDTWIFRRQVLKNESRRAERHAVETINDQEASEDSRHGNLRPRVREASS